MLEDHKELDQTLANDQRSSGRVLKNERKYRYGESCIGKGHYQNLKPTRPNTCADMFRRDVPNEAIMLALTGVL
jgi:hypothetical protein